MNGSRCVRSADYGGNDVNKWGWKTSPFFSFSINRYY